MTINSPARATLTDSSVTLKAVHPRADRRAKVKRFLGTLMRSLAAAHA